MKGILLARAPPGAEGCTVKGDKNEATKPATHMVWYVTNL